MYEIGLVYWHSLGGEPFKLLIGDMLNEGNELDNRYHPAARINVGIQGYLVRWNATTVDTLMLQFSSVRFFTILSPKAVSTMNPEGAGAAMQDVETTVLESIRPGLRTEVTGAIDGFNGDSADRIDEDLTTESDDEQNEGFVEDESAGWSKQWDCALDTSNDSNNSNVQVDELENDNWSANITHTNHTNLPFSQLQTLVVKPLLTEFQLMEGHEHVGRKVEVGYAYKSNCGGLFSFYILDNDR